MAINYFIGWEQEDLERELRAAQEDLAAGKSMIQSSAGDAEGRFMREASITERIKALLKALNVVDPATYPIDQISAITVTKVALS